MSWTSPGGSRRAPRLPARRLPPISPIPGQRFAHPPAPSLGRQVLTPRLQSTCPARRRLSHRFLACSGTRCRGPDRAARAQSPGGRRRPNAAQLALVLTPACSLPSGAERCRLAPRQPATRPAPPLCPLSSRPLRSLPHAGPAPPRPPALVPVRSLPAAALRHWRTPRSP